MACQASTFLQISKEEVICSTRTGNAPVHVPVGGGATLKKKKTTKSGGALRRT